MKKKDNTTIPKPPAVKVSPANAPATALVVKTPPTANPPETPIAKRKKTPQQKQKRDDDRTTVPMNIHGQMTDLQHLLPHIESMNVPPDAAASIIQTILPNGVPPDAMPAINSLFTVMKVIGPVPTSVNDIFRMAMGGMSAATPSAAEHKVTLDMIAQLSAAKRNKTPTVQANRQVYEASQDKLQRLCEQHICTNELGRYDANAIMDHLEADILARQNAFDESRNLGLFKRGVAIPTIDVALPYFYLSDIIDNLFPTTTDSESDMCVWGNYCAALTHGCQLTFRTRNVKKRPFRRWRARNEIVPADEPRQCFLCEVINTYNKYIAFKEAGLSPSCILQSFAAVCDPEVGLPSDALIFPETPFNGLIAPFFNADWILAHLIAPPDDATAVPYKILRGLTARSLCRLQTVHDALVIVNAATDRRSLDLAIKDRSDQTTDKRRFEPSAPAADPMVRYWLHLFALQHLPELVPGQYPFPGEHCTIHAGVLPRLPIVDHTKYIVRGKEPLCTTSNNSVQLLLSKIFNKALPRVCMFRSLNLTLLPALDNRQVYDYLNDVLLVFLTGGYPTAGIRPSLTLSAAIVSMLRAFDPRKSLVEQHMGVHMTDFSKELFTICMRKFKNDDTLTQAQRDKLATEMALTIHNTWVYQFVLLYHVALYEVIHVGGSIWMQASDAIHNTDPRHRAYLDLIRTFADRLRTAFIEQFEPLAEHAIDTPLHISHVPAWRSFLKTCKELTCKLKTQLPKYILRTRTSVEKRLEKAISSCVKNAEPALSWPVKEQLARLAAITVCDPTYCGPKFRVLRALGLQEIPCAIIEEITFGFMGGVASKHKTTKLCEAFVNAVPLQEILLIQHYLLLCRAFSCISSSPLDRTTTQHQREALVGKFGRINALTEIQHHIYYCLAHQQCLLGVIDPDGRHTHISAFQLPQAAQSAPWKKEAFADVDGPRKTGPWLCVSQLTCQPWCSYSVGAKKETSTLLLDNRQAQHTSLLGVLIGFERYKSLTFCVDCASRHVVHKGLWTGRGTTCGIHQVPVPTGAHDFSTGDPALDTIYSYRAPLSIHHCAFDGCVTLENLTRIQTWDETRHCYRAVSVCRSHLDGLMSSGAFTRNDYAMYNTTIGTHVIELSELQRVLDANMYAVHAKKVGAFHK